MTDREKVEALLEALRKVHAYIKESADDARYEWQHGGATEYNQGREVAYDWVAEEIADVLKEYEEDRAEVYSATTIPVYKLVASGLNYPTSGDATRISRKGKK